MPEKKERLDLVLVKKGIIQSREKAKAYIMAGQIFVDGLRIDKCGEKVKEDSIIEFRGQELRYVSRGGLKLEKAVNSFGIHLEGKVCMDIGASTGGFTDCMLQNDAIKVFALDVGYGQFAWKLRTDPRVVCIERTNVRYMTFETIGEFADFASIDVSFISLKKIIPPVINLLKEDGEIVALIKPQFEAGREKVGKKGVVREPETQIEVIQNIINFIKESHWNIISLDFSPIRGPEGNIEFLIYFSKMYHDYAKDNLDKFSKEYIENLVNNAHLTTN
jgi:23S rRNA (cytidine1920-2'-O)/16S rRNA (cytidine1409-2'-O)-methyltransferase